MDTDGHRWTQMDTDKELIKSLTAETSLDAARDPEPVEGQSTQREKRLRTTDHGTTGQRS